MFSFAMSHFIAYLNQPQKNCRYVRVYADRPS
jgi:hypothetical protein